VAINWALLQAFDGRQDEAAKHLLVGMRSADFWRFAPDVPLLRPLTSREDYRAAINNLGSVLDAQRVEVLEMLCGPDPVSKSYQPAPETCAKVE